ncbi:MAG: hypothetical protein WAK26_18150 [Terracidiphilus sp.]
MGFIGLMLAILAGSALVRSIAIVTGSTVARKTNSTGCGCLAIIALLALIAFFTIM